MPLFAALFSAFFSAFGVFLAKLFIARLGLRIIGATLLIGLFTALVGTFNAFIVPLAASLFNTAYGQFIGLAFPPIAGTVVTTFFLAWSAVQVYRLKVRVVNLTASM